VNIYATVVYINGVCETRWVDVGVFTNALLRVALYKLSQSVRRSVCIVVSKRFSSKFFHECGRAIRVTL